MRGYYSETLSGRRLRRCYEVASPRVQQYLEAEIRFAESRLEPEDVVLELGCGYGRVLARLADCASRVVGIDTSGESLVLARRTLGSRCDLLRMDALRLAFAGATFSKVICLQNGICAFGVDRAALLREALRVARPGGCVLFSTYADRFWPERLRWFEAQSAAGLLGAIDYDRTGDGTIVCKDGFRAGRVAPATWKSLSRSLGMDAAVIEVDESSLWCEITAR